MLNSYTQSSLPSLTKRLCLTHSTIGLILVLRLMTDTSLATFAESLSVTPPLNRALNSYIIIIQSLILCNLYNYALA